MKKLFTPLFLSLFLVACGGSSESSDNTKDINVQGIYDISGTKDTTYFLINKKLEVIEYDYLDKKNGYDGKINCYDKLPAAKLTINDKNKYDWVGDKEITLKQATLLAVDNAIIIVSKTANSKEKRDTFQKTNKTVADLTPLCE